MTKEHYFLMCEQIGIEPDPDEIPLDFNDLSYDAQLALKVFNSLPDRIEGMSGSWLGKDYSGLAVLLDIYEVDNRQEVFELMMILTNETDTHYKQQQKQKSKSKGRK